jgi:mono/diheme cytochrome c family protein
MKTAITAGLLVGGAWLGLVYTSAQSPPLKSAPKLEEASRVINSLDGPTLYIAYCAVCHGAGAKGDGPMAKMLTAKTPDLTRIAERHGGKLPRAQLQGIISGETAVPSGHGTREMPIWGPIFSQVSWDMDLGRVRVDNLARYLESLQEK